VESDGDEEVQKQKPKLIYSLVNKYNLKDPYCVYVRNNEE